MERTEDSRAGGVRVSALALVAGLLVLGATLLAGPAGLARPDAARAEQPPVWVDDTEYGSAGGGYYWDFTSGMAWTPAQGWHLYHPVVIHIIILPCWVNFIFYGSAGGGFYLDPRSGLVWTPERGWHRFDPRPPRDSDHDGTPDIFDRCPNVPGPVGNYGCPLPGNDQDGDGVPDTADLCPTVPGPLSNQGCPLPSPDQDGDGIPDIYDRCPTVPGPASNYGCPVATAYTSVVTIGRGEGSLYQVGETARICYNLAPVGTPYHFRIWRITQGGAVALIAEGNDNGVSGGDCLYATVGFPTPDVRTIKFEAFVWGNLVAMDTTWFRVGTAYVTAPGGP